MDKHRFLVCYEYGMGGLWAFIYARSADEILMTYPEVTVVETAPCWMTADVLADLESRETHDIDGQPFGVLDVILAERNHD